MSDDRAPVVPYDVDVAVWGELLLLQIGEHPGGERLQRAVGNTCLNETIAWKGRSETAVAFGTEIAAEGLEGGVVVGEAVEKKDDLLEGELETHRRRHWKAERVGPGFVWGATTR